MGSAIAKRRSQPWMCRTARLGIHHPHRIRQRKKQGPENSQISKGHLVLLLPSTFPFKNCTKKKLESSEPWPIASPHQWNKQRRQILQVTACFHPSKVSPTAILSTSITQYPTCLQQHSPPPPEPQEHARKKQRCWPSADSGCKPQGLCMPA